MSERDELAAVITKAYIEKHEGAIYTGGHAPVDEPIADAILAAGYRRPHTITTVEELDALVEGTEIVDKYARLKLEESVLGFLEWSDGHGNAACVNLPATVLWEPAA